MQMSLDDFDRLTPTEYAAVFRSFERTHLREGWEHARFIACACLQPWTKKTLKPQDVCKFEWDNEHLKAIQHKTGTTAQSTRERVDELLKRINNA